MIRIESASENTFQLGSQHNPLKIQYTVRSEIRQKSDLDIWLTERYCLYNQNKQYLKRFEIAHKSWPLQNLSIQSLEMKFQSLPEFIVPQNLHSTGVQVLAWGGENL